MRITSSRFSAALLAGALFTFSSPAAAQAWHYAAMQPAGVESNEANFIISGFGDYGMSFIGQYRWAVDKRTQIWADVGVATPSGTTYFLVGASGAWNFMKPTADKPIDVSATLGLYGALAGSSNVDWVRIPIGIERGGAHDGVVNEELHRVSGNQTAASGVGHEAALVAVLH